MGRGDVHVLLIIRQYLAENHPAGSLLIYLRLACSSQRSTVLTWGVTTQTVGRGIGAPGERLQASLKAARQRRRPEGGRAPRKPPRRRWSGLARCGASSAASAACSAPPAATRRRRVLGVYPSSVLLVADLLRLPHGPPVLAVQQHNVTERIGVLSPLPEFTICIWLVVPSNHPRACGHALCRIDLGYGMHVGS